jgi:hypothetical protein
MLPHRTCPTEHANLFQIGSNKQATMHNKPKTDKAHCEGADHLLACCFCGHWHSRQRHYRTGVTCCSQLLPPTHPQHCCRLWESSKPFSTHAHLPMLNNSTHQRQHTLNTCAALMTCTCLTPHKANMVTTAPPLSPARVTNVPQPLLPRFMAHLYPHQVAPTWSVPP